MANEHIDWTDSDSILTFKLSKETLDSYYNDNTYIYNSAARENPEQSLFDAIIEHSEEYDKITINGKNISTFIKDL